MTTVATVQRPDDRCPDTQPHRQHEWYGVPAAIRRECRGVPQPGDHLARPDNHPEVNTMTNPTGLAMLAEVAADKVHRDQAGRSWYRTWSNEVTREVKELVDAGWLSTRFVDGQWLVTAAGQAALKAATRG